MRQRGVRRWELRVSLGTGTDGKRDARSKHVQADDEGAARVELARWMNDLGLEPAKATTLGEVIEAWFDQTAPKRTVGGNERVRGVIDRHLTGLSDWKIDEVDGGRLERYYQRCRKTVGKGGARRQVPLADQTIRQIHYVVRPALAMARRWGWVDRNVAEDVPLGKKQGREYDLPPVEEVLALLDAADRHLGMPLFVRLAAATGMRRGEIAGLQRGDIDWMNSTITVNRTLTEVAGGNPRTGREMIPATPKTKRSRRTVTVDFETLGATERHLTDLAARGADDGPRRWVFPDLNRDAAGAVPVRPTTWSTRFFWLKNHLGVDMRLHDLRHLHASFLLATREIDIAAVSARLGHSRTSTTTDIYGHLMASSADGRSAEIVADRLRRP